VAAKKYDLEGWSPREGKYIELMSCSNCTSYQAVRLNIKYREGDENRYVHTLNSTMVATSRALRLILENYQRQDGSVEVPKALQPYMGGKKEIVRL
jgi:seryl-tRNA synthetase